MSCGCSSVHTPPTITSCNATYNVCTGKSFYINVIGCTDPIVTIPTQSEIGYPIVGLLEYSESNKKIYYTHNGSNSGVATTDSFTYTVNCNGVSKTCTITVNIDDSISVDTTVVELDGCCIPAYTSKVYGSTIYSIIVDNVNILNTSYTSDTALSTFLNTYINVNGTFTVTKTTVSDVINWTIVLESNTKVLNSVTGLSLVQGIKTLCGCKLGDVEYTWTIPDCATLVTGYSVHDCKIQVIVPLYDVLDDACCPIELTVRCGNCTSNCEKTEVYNWCPPIYENCQTPDCSLYPCTTYNPISGNCDNICDECDTCCQNENGYYCAECCDNNDCALANCPEASQPICVGQECVCYVNGIEVEPLPNGCCPNCTELTVLPNCHTCVNGIIVAPDTTCPTNKVYNYDTCQCECDCLNGFCYNVLTQNCEPCPVCTTITGLYTCNGEPYTATLAPCTQCINNEIVPVICAGNSIPNPYFNPNNPVSVTNPCCISLTPCDCDNPDCVGQGSVCTHIEGSDECYCVDCTSLSCTNTSVICEEVNGCDCVGNACVSGCPTCTGTVSIKEYCTPFFVKYEGCNNNNDKYRFKVYELTNLIEQPLTGCTYDDYLNIPASGLTDITNSLLPADLQYNTSSSVFFIDGTLSSNYLVIDKLGVQTMLIKVKKYGIETIYEFVIDGNTCILASEENSDTDLVTPANPRIFRETCKFIYGLKSTGVCPFNDYEWDFEVTEDTNTAIEIQDGKYIVIFPPDFPLGTTREVCVTGKYVYDEVVCYSKEACKDYTPCTGGCGCNPCTDPNSGLQTSIETITDAINGTITASASVLINCNGTLGGVLALCEAANSSENCSPLNNVNNYGTSPLPFSAYEDFLNDTNASPCTIWNCNESEPTGCGTEGQAPCGWLYDDTKLVVDNYNEATIKVSFVDGEVKGKLCWAAKYECGYVCNCIEVDKVINCEDYGITDVSINCTPTPTSTNVGSIVVTVNNYSDPYKIEVYKQGTPNTLLGTYPPSPATSIVTSPYTITIPESWGITNGDELIIKVIMLVDGLDCDYEETVDYTCCNINMTASPIIACLDTDGGSILIANMYTATCNAGIIIATSPPNWSVSGTSPYYINYPVNTSAGVYDVVLDWTCGTCTGRTTMPVTLNKPVVTSAPIRNECASTTNPTTVSLYSGLNVTPVSSVSNTVFQTGINVVCNSDGTISGSTNILNPGTWTTPTFGDTTIYYQYTDIAGCKSCGSFIVTIDDCCTLTLGTPTQLCNGAGELISVTFPFSGATYPVIISGTTTYDHNGDGTGDFILNPVVNGIVTITDNTITEFVVPYPAVPNLESNCIIANLTFTDDNGCVETITTTCTPCTPTVSFKCDNGNCYDPGDGTGTHTTENACKNSCPCTAMTLTSVTGCLANNTVNIIPVFTAACNDIDNNIVVGNIVSITDDNNPSNSWTITPDPLPLLPQNYTITYPQGIAPGTYNLTANWVCGVCNGNTQFTVTITTILITVSNITNDCNAQSPSSVNLYSAIQGGNNTNTIFRIPDINDNPVCDSSGTLTGGILLNNNIWTTVGINTIYYEYTDNTTQCKKCGSFEVTITDCCVNSMTIGDVSGCLSDGSININAAFAEACIGGGITALVENNALSNAWGITASYPNYTISYPPSIIPGTYILEATWECGTCTDITEFNVTINPNPSVTATSHTDVCPFDLNLLLTVSPTGGTTIFKTGSTCQNDGTLSGGTDIMFPTNYNTNIPNQAIQYQYTINGCSVCGEFTVTCCSVNAGDDTNQTYCY